MTEFNQGDRRELVLTEDLTRTQIVMYAGASGDFNPLHTDATFARDAAGYPGVFAHGMLTMGMTGRILTDWVGVDRLTSFSARFVKQVWPGDRLVAVATVTDVAERDGRTIVEFSVESSNQDGDVVLTGTASARLN